MWLWLPVLTLLVVSLCYVASGHLLLEGENVVEGTFKYQFLLFVFRELFAGQSDLFTLISEERSKFGFKNQKNE